VLQIVRYCDDGRFPTGVGSLLVGVTFTVHHKNGIGKCANILLRPEYHNANSFTHKDDFRSMETQYTLGMGAVVYF